MLWLSSVKVSCWQKLRVNATVSILRGDYSPQGCDDITRVSIFGGDMGHWWWWWWWCVSTWGLPPTWRGTDSNKKDIWRHQVLDLGCFVDAVVSIIWNCRLVCSAITQTQGQGFISNDLIYLSPRIIYLPWWSCESHKQLHFDSKKAINEKTISSNKVRMLHHLNTSLLRLTFKWIRLQSVQDP